MRSQLMSGSVQGRVTASTPLQAFRGPNPSSSGSSCAHHSRHASSLRPANITHRRPFVTDVAPDATSSLAARRVQCRGLFGLGLPEIAVIAGIAALVFGPSKLPELGKGLGQTVKSFQTAAKEFETELKAASAPAEDEQKPPQPEDPSTKKKE